MIQEPLKLKEDSIWCVPADEHDGLFGHTSPVLCDDQCKISQHLRTNRVAAKGVIVLPVLGYFTSVLDIHKPLFSLGALNTNLQQVMHQHCFEPRLWLAHELFDCLGKHEKQSWISPTFKCPLQKCVARVLRPCDK